MKVFISYSHKDGRWLDRLLVHLKPLERHGIIDPWSDTRIKPGEKWREEIQDSLLSSQVGIILVSADFLASDFIASNELPPLLLRAKQQECLIISIVVGRCLFSQIQALQQFQAANSPDKPLSAMTKDQSEGVLLTVAQRILGIASPGEHPDRKSNPRKMPKPLKNATRFKGSPEIDNLIAGVALGDWDAAERVALQVLEKTNDSGSNDIFDALFEYQDCSDEDSRFWGARQTIESCVQLAPWLIRHDQLARLASHQNFSVRSTAAAICMDLANSAPDKAPIDLLLKLSVYDEDWYVQAPAVAAIKTMARTFPSVLRIFYDRLESNTAEARFQAATAINEVAKKEPKLLDQDRLKKELRSLKAQADKHASAKIASALRELQGVKAATRFRYGL